MFARGYLTEIGWIPLTFARTWKGNLGRLVRLKPGWSRVSRAIGYGRIQTYPSYKKDHTGYKNVTRVVG
jgi:hypothetical protein